jgi:hypothetical protein
MPSRKKAKGQARKAEKERQQAKQARAQQRASCEHFTLRENATREDIDAAVSLFKEYIDKLNAILRSGREVNRSEATSTLDHQTYNKYFQYNDVRKQVFRVLILAEGTTHCVKESNEKDLATHQLPMRAYHFIHLLATIEVGDKHQGSFDAQSQIEFMEQRNATLLCPRETIRFFHRRNSCDCLHEIYFKLKDTTSRTTSCWNCDKLVDIKKAFHCKCDMVKYCSKKCALDFWPEHKERCTNLPDQGRGGMR